MQARGGLTSMGWELIILDILFRLQQDGSLTAEGGLLDGLINSSLGHCRLHASL